MGFSARLQLLTCLLVYAPCAHSIMVKYGTKDGPIEPPAPEPSPPPSRPYRSPAPVWEERPIDLPDPNAQWRPQPTPYRPLYTHVVYSNPPPPVPLNNAQRFVNSYIPNPQVPKAIPAEPITNYFTPAQILGSQRVPGFGLRYFVPAYDNTPKNVHKHEDLKPNQIETNEVEPSRQDSSSDFQWKYEKDAVRRVQRTAEEAVVPVYMWPAYVPPRHH